jgi:hypothetical protein
MTVYASLLAPSVSVRLGHSVVYANFAGIHSYGKPSAHLGSSVKTVVNARNGRRNCLKISKTYIKMKKLRSITSDSFTP